MTARQTKTEHIGIYITKKGKYSAQVSVTRAKTLYLGKFKTLEDALSARNEILSEHKPHLLEHYKAKSKGKPNEQLAGTPWYGL